MGVLFSVYALLGEVGGPAVRAVVLALVLDDDDDEHTVGGG